ncbi:YggS family pyridoxal phosphate-dependent enzyme [Patescibacteria group bacterium AH-259-L07]|nr:YggS family pyridoxal phosphate-dependent enzyme [Patescibacteria group bacterium AH-259-L07]
MDITINIKNILDELPHNVRLVVAGKGRTLNELNKTVQAGVKIIGHNYVQEADKTYQAMAQRVELHLIGHLQTNKAKKAARIFDMIQTVDSVKLAKEIDTQCHAINKKMPVLIGVNVGRESQKSGVFPEHVIELIKEISLLAHIKIVGLMTMAPRFDNKEHARPYFVKTKKLFDVIGQLTIDNVAVGYYRKTHIAKDEKGLFSPGSNITAFSNSLLSFGVCVCADIDKREIFKEYASQGARIIFEAAAPGLYGDQEDRNWQSGFNWWKNECRTKLSAYARTYKIHIAVATQAGRTIDEDFPGGGYVFDPKGEIIHATPDWKEGILYADIRIL